MKNPLSGKAHPEPFFRSQRQSQTVDCSAFTANAAPQAFLLAAQGHITVMSHTTFSLLPMDALSPSPFRAFAHHNAAFVAAHGVPS
jgi:hypothetical protein